MQREGENIGLPEPDEDVSTLLRSMDRVDAPENFERRVKQRIAFGEKPATFDRAILMLALKFAVPAVVLIGLGVFLVYYNQKTPPVASLPEVTDTFATNTKPAVHQPDQNTVASVPRESNENIANTRNANRLQRLNSNPKSPDLSGSDQIAVDQANEPLHPPGINPNPQSIPKKSPTGGSISPDSILSFLGAKSSCSSTSCKILEVETDSMAEKAGVLAGDIVEAIGDQPIDPKHPLGGNLNFHSLRVNRGGKIITISLGSK